MGCQDQILGFCLGGLMPQAVAQQTRATLPMLGHCWPTVYAAGLALGGRGVLAGK